MNARYQQQPESQTELRTTNLETKHATVFSMASPRGPSRHPADAPLRRPGRAHGAVLYWAMPACGELPVCGGNSANSDERWPAPCVCPCQFPIFFMFAARFPATGQEATALAGRLSGTARDQAEGKMQLGRASCAKARSGGTRRLPHLALSCLYLAIGACMLTDVRSEPTSLNVVSSLGGAENIGGGAADRGFVTSPSRRRRLVASMNTSDYVAMLAGERSIGLLLGGRDLCRRLKYDTCS